MTNESQNKLDPLMYFRDLIAFNGIDEMLKDFSFKVSPDGGGLEIEGSDLDHWAFASDKFTSFSKYISPDLEKEAKKSINEIQAILLYNDLTVNRIEIENELKHLQKLSLKQENTKSYPVISDTLQGILDYTLKDEQGSTSNLKWVRADTDLLVLITALFKSGAITNENGGAVYKKDLYAKFSKFLNIELKDPASKLSHTTGEETYLDSLKSVWDEYDTDRLLKRDQNK